MPRINPSLELMRLVVSRYPQLLPKAPVVTIGGTNGKGTTAGYLFGLLSKATQLRIGLYTSPHVISFSERIQLSHKLCDDHYLADIWRKLSPLLNDFQGRLSFFECATLLAFRVFNIENNDLNIIEVGLGGTWDATNICQPIAAVIVSIGLDHQRYLGNSYADIFADKLGISRTGKPLFWGNQGRGASDRPAQATLDKIVREKQLTIWQAGRDFALLADRQLQITIEGLPTIDHLNLPKTVADQPRYLQENFVLAFAVCWWLIDRLGQSSQQLLDVIADRHDLLPRSVKGRFQLLHNGQLLVDACHNHDGATVFAEAIKNRYGTLAGAVALLADKEVDNILSELSSCLDPLLIFAIDNERSITCNDLPQRWHSNWHDNFVSAWQTLERYPQRPLVVCGSFFGIAEALMALPPFSLHS